MHSSTVVLCALAALVLKFLWKLLHPYVLRSPLDVIPGPPSTSLTKGNIAQIFDRDSWPFLDSLTNDYQPVVKLHGLFGKRVLWVFDPKALHHVVLKDQDIYEEGEMNMLVRRLMFGVGLFGTMGDHHRRQRKLLNPVFSIAHMRHLTPIFYETAHRLCEGISIQLKTSETKEVDILSWMGRTALELIGKGGFGHSFDPLVRSKSDPYAEAVKQMIPTASRLFALRALAPIYMPVLKLAERYTLVKRFLTHLVPWIPHPALHDMKAIIDTLDRTSREIYAEKKRALVSGDVDVKLGIDERRDLMSVLLRENMKAAEEDRLPEEEIIGQMSTFTLAGADTTSNALARILHLLCNYPEVQEKLRREIVDARTASGDHDLEYNDLVELPYLDAVCRETMRLYPPVSFMNRETTRDIVLPVSSPISCSDGSTMSSIPISKGTSILIGIYSSNRNKEIWGEDATEWKPERWLGDGVPESVTEAKIPGVYSNLMTFLGGGRACIGFKFSQLEMKVVLTTLLTSFRFSLIDGEKGNIKWNRAGVAFPSSVKKGDEKPCMPIQMEII